MHSTADTRVVDAAGDLRDTRVLRVFQRRCEGALDPGRGRVMLDLANVTSADSKLVAMLVMFLRRAHAERAPLQLTVSDHVYDWITLCQVERLLHPRCAQRQAVMRSKALGEVPNQATFVR